MRGQSPSAVAIHGRGVRRGFLAMKSYPLIETELGDTEQRFIEFAERHARAGDLPQDTIRLRIATSLDDESYQARRSIEVVGDGERLWRIEHSLKQTEAQQSRSVQLETRFELTGPGVPDGYGRRTEIEALVDVALDAMLKRQPRGAT